VPVCVELQTACQAREGVPMGVFKQISGEVSVGLKTLTLISAREPLAGLAA
jgi:hypothetical protein